MTRDETIIALRRIQLLTEDEELSDLLGELLKDEEADLGYDS